MSEDEYFFVKESLNSKAILSPKLLIKDHKFVNDDGTYPTRLVVPATNFTSAFSKLGYIGIKQIIDAAGINYSKKNYRSSITFENPDQISWNQERQAHDIQLGYRGLLSVGYLWPRQTSHRVLLQAPGREREEEEEQGLPQNDCVWNGQHSVDFR
jgi:hypothetical protein